ncbi:MAG: acyl-ACP--UDP-N-acetylglucosamine O-acyltransferase [Ignavibacteriales bacterium]|nr:acyl-ACP--UDP-N-acetylglucosamine O-acyltransferase [Ignavibacteriales bacterium]
MSVSIDSHAIVSPKAKLGDGVRVGAFSIIEDDVVIGDGTWIGAHVGVYNGSRIGHECKIHQAAAVGSPPQDLKYKGEPTLLEVGEKTIIREYVTLNRGTIENGKTSVGSNCLLMAYTHVAHDCIVGNNAILANCATLGGHVTLGEWVIVGGLTPVHQFCRIGDHAMIGGGFRVVKDVPPYVLAGQEPLTFEGLNLVGLRRRGLTAQAIEHLDKAFRLLYRSNLNVSQAVARIVEEVELTTEVQNLIQFIASSKRGIIFGHSNRS